MNRQTSRIAALFAASLGAASAPAAETLDEALSASEWGLSFRYRLELVDEDGFDENAEASTLLTRLNLKTGSYRGWQGFVELTDVRAIGLDDYNAGAGSTPDRVRFPVVADPEDTRLNQAWIGWMPSESVNLRAGRQRIKLDQDRFVGNVGWRQNEQTFDGASLEWNKQRWKLFYSYIGHANRIFDSNVPAGDHDHDSHLLHGDLRIDKAHTLTAYVYEIEDQDQQALSNRSVGLRYTGAVDIGAGRSLNLLTEVAHQTETGDAPVDFDAGYERLEGSRAPGQAFRTPLATLHAFNGWADRFLTTPDRGLDDFYIGLSGKRGRYGWTAVAHRFWNETGATRLGDELDASVSIRLHRTSTLLLKLAHFESSDAQVVDATKFWLMATFDLP
jgi:hypothetical protein